MAYLGLSPEPSQTEQCLYFCEWQAARNAARARGDAILTMEIVDRPPGCTCPDEVAQPTSIYNKGASGSGYWIMVAAIAALLLINR